MLEHIKISLRITVVLLVITCGLYPALVWAIGQTAFRHQAFFAYSFPKGAADGTCINPSVKNRAHDFYFTGPGIAVFAHIQIEADHLEVFGRIDPILFQKIGRKDCGLP